MHALVVEGGGMRGAYAAGVLLGLARRGEAFDAVYASSSGACSAAYLAAGQEEGVTIWEDHLHGARLLRPANLARFRPLLDLDYLFDEVFARRVPLDVAALRASPIPLWITLTRARDGEVEYHDLRAARDPLVTLRASAALPIAYPKAVTVEGERYIDGGIGDPIPVARALRDGATHVTAVLTKPAGYRRGPSPGWLSLLGASPYPGARRALDSLHERYNAAIDLLKSPPAGLAVRIVQPPEDLPIKRLTHARRILRRAVRQGEADAASAAAATS